MTKTDTGAATITTEELRKLLEDVTPGDWIPAAMGDLSLYVTQDDAEGPVIATIDTWSPHDSRLIALAPYLARRVIAAEKMVDAIRDLAEFPRTDMHDSEFKRGWNGMVQYVNVRCIASLREYEETK